MEQGWIIRPAEWTGGSSRVTNTSHPAANETLLLTPWISKQHGRQADRHTHLLQSWWMGLAVTAHHYFGHFIAFRQNNVISADCVTALGSVVNRVSCQVILKERGRKKKQGKSHYEILSEFVWSISSTCVSRHNTDLKQSQGLHFGQLWKTNPFVFSEEQVKTDTAVFQSVTL